MVLGREIQQEVTRSLGLATVLWGCGPRKEVAPPQVEGRHPLTAGGKLKTFQRCTVELLQEGSPRLLWPHLSSLLSASYSALPSAPLASFSFFFPLSLFFFGSEACWILVPRPGIKPTSPAVEAQALNHWTTREAPPFPVFKSSNQASPLRFAPCLAHTESHGLHPSLAGLCGPSPFQNPRRGYQHPPAMQVPTVINILSLSCSGFSA